MMLSCVQRELLKMKEMLAESEASRDAERKRLEQLTEKNAKLNEFKALLQQQLETAPADSLATKRVSAI